MLISEFLYFSDDEMYQDTDRSPESKKGMLYMQILLNIFYYLSIVINHCFDFSTSVN